MIHTTTWYEDHSGADPISEDEVEARFQRMTREAEEFVELAEWQEETEQWDE